MQPLRDPSLRGLGLYVSIILLAFTANRSCAQTPSPDYVPRSMDDLQQLVAPIALYPDALLAQVLTAATYPDDVIAAAKWEDGGGDPQSAGSQPWDSSVQGVAHYPAVLHYMAANGDWLNDLGDAFLNQQQDVMAAVQALRGEAVAAGTLVDTPQQTVINQDGFIQIIPTDPGYLYAPVYDPAVVYAPPAYEAGGVYTSYVTFGPRVAVGDWLDFDFDWHDRAIYSGRWGRDRPWWNGRGASYHYLDLRPGIYQPGRFRDVRGRPIVVQENHWTRDARRPAPRRVDRPIARPVVRPERGFPDRGNPPRVVETPRGADVARESERGRNSRAATEAPRTVAPPKRETEPARAAPRPAAPEARPSAPTRGGAMGGYTNGAAAAHSAERGAASRGGGAPAGGGGGGGRSGGGGHR